MQGRVALGNAFVPFERRGQCVNSVLDVDDSTVRGSDGGCGCVQNQWAKRENAALLDEAILLRLGATDFIDPIRQETTMPMRTVDDPYGAIISAARIQMNAHGEHVLKNRHGRLNVVNAGLLGPRAEARHLDALTCRNRKILMPNNLPVGVRRFVEKNRADCETLIAKHGGSGGTSSGRRGQSAHRRVR